MTVTEKNTSPWLHVSFTDRAGTQKSGPLGLLWSLIESYEVDIFEVRLSKITRDFTLFLEQNPIPLDERTDFVAMAARLILYKSKMLLPNPGFEEVGEPDSLPIELVEQLLEYKRFQQTGEILRDLEEKTKLSFAPAASWDAYEKDLDYLDVDLLSLLTAFQGFLQRVEREKPLQLEKETESVEELMQYLVNLLDKLGNVSFFEIIAGFSLIKLIVCFLALLELLRLRVIGVSQSGLMNDMRLSLKENGIKIFAEKQ